MPDARPRGRSDADGSPSAAVRRHAVAMAALLVLFPGVARPAELSAEAARIVAQLKNTLLEVQVVDISTGTKSSAGTGFRVAPAGFVVTNYHVVSKFVEYPALHRIRCIATDRSETPATLVDVDVVNDVALLKVQPPGPEVLQLVDKPPEKGARIFALGFPMELGLTVVEGTYNGVIKESLYGRIHLTASLNSGMSGGPAVTAAGSVMGINVATRGNQISFLVPVESARVLIQRQSKQGAKVAPDLRQRIGLQLLENQERYIGDLLKRPLPTIELGNYAVPGQLAPYLKCWGSSSHEPGNRYRSSRYLCEIEESLFLSPSHRTGFLSLTHVLVSSQQMSRFGLYQLYHNEFQGSYASIAAWKNDVTNFDCTTRFVTSNGLTFRVVFCLRAYKRFPGLYDAVLHVATRGTCESIGASTAS
ncbi:MAG: trypsin-like peptidase domain-containing protein [Candidatus Riflebacteria bacterium]|nr:trypsin-like peptidase domain-containing protein [Candidatus Riflebacteria bacterium]